MTLLLDFTLAAPAVYPGPLLVVEDGTIVPNANTFVTISDVSAYAGTHIDDGGADWLATPALLQSRSIVIAGEYLRNESRYMYRGTRQDVVTQRLPWPRTNASEYRGPFYPNGVIPWRMKDAQCDLALRLVTLGLVSATALQPDLDRGGMTASERVGPIAAAYMKNAPPETVLQTIHGILAPILRERISDISPTYAQPTDLTPFIPGEWDYVETDPVEALPAGSPDSDGDFDAN